MKKRMLIRIGSALMGLFILCACGEEEEEEEKTSVSHVREERTVEEEDIKEPQADPEPAVTDVPEQTVTEEPGIDELKAAVLNRTGASEDEVQVFEYDDFDGDGKHEAFVLIGEKGEDYGDGPLVEGAVWYASANQCYKLDETGAMGYRDTARIMEIGGTKYVMFDDIFVTQAVTKVWYVEGGAREADFSSVGEVVTSSEKDRFYIMYSSYDASLDPDMDMPVGHTWKYYYFFYNSEEGKVNEYAGTTIDAETVEFLCGRDLLAEIMSAEDKIDGIFCRGNGQIVINYEYAEAGTTNFEHYIYDFSDECYLDDYGQKLDEPSPQAGICAHSVCPAIASYPEVPGPDDMVWYGE